MTTADGTEPRQKLSPDELRLRTLVARTLWRLQEQGSETDPSARKEAFKAVRRDYEKSAQRLIRLLKAKGVELSLSQGTGKEDDADED